MSSDRMRLLAAALLALAALPAGAEPTPAALETRRFEVVHRKLEDAFRLVSPLLSERAEVRILRAERALELRDERTRLDEVLQALREFDVAPRRVRLAVRLLKGEKREAAQPGDADVVPPDVRAMVAYNSFESLGSLELLAEEGLRSGGMADAEGRFKVSIHLGAVDRAAGTIEVKLLELSRRAQGAEDRVVYLPVFQFKEVLTSGRTRVLFATPSAGDRRALFLVLSGEID